MSIYIDISNPVGSDGGVRNDGTINSKLEKVQPTSALGTSASIDNSLVLVGDSSSGSVIWSEITTESNNFDEDDVPIFNTEGDLYYIELSVNDIIESIDWLITTPGVYTTDNPSVDVWYWDENGVLQEQLGLTLPDFTTTGIKRLMLNGQINQSMIGLTPDPRGTTYSYKAIYLKFNGITSVVTSPLASMVWKRRTPSAEKVIQDLTDSINQADKSDYTDTKILPLEGDVVLIGSDHPWAKMYVDIERPRDSSLQSELIYSKGSENQVFSSDQLFLESNSTGDEVWTEAIGQYEDCITPPSDWSTRNITTPDNTVHTCYWVGWKYTQDADAPSLLPLVNIDIQPFNTQNNNFGVIVGSSNVFKYIEISLNSSATTDSVFVISNLTNGDNFSITFPANFHFIREEINFSVSEGDEISVQQIFNKNSDSPSDGYIRLC